MNANGAPRKPSGRVTPDFRLKREALSKYRLSRCGASAIANPPYLVANSHSLMVSRLWLNTALAMKGSFGRNFGWPTSGCPL